MENQKLFQATIESLNIKTIYTDGFTPEQIYYQVDELTKNRLNEIEEQINRKMTKETKINSFEHQNDEYSNEDIGSSNIVESTNEIEGSDQMQTLDNFSIDNESEALNEAESDDAVEDTIENSDDDTAAVGDTIESSDDISESKQDDRDKDLEGWDSENTVDFDREEWEDSYSSLDEIANKPASQTIELLAGKKSKRK